MQSSCTKPDLEAESGPVDNMQEFSPLKCGEEYPSGAETQEVETCIRLGQTLVMNGSHAGGKFLPHYCKSSVIQLLGREECLKLNQTCIFFRINYAQKW